MVLYGFPRKLLVKLASFFLKAKSLAFLGYSYSQLSVIFHVQKPRNIRYLQIFRGFWNFILIYSCL